MSRGRSPKTGVAARLGVRCVDQYCHGGLHYQQLRSSSLFDELLVKSSLVDDPPQRGHLLESKLGSIQVLSCYVVELRVEQLCFALRSLGRVRDLDPGASFLLALQQGLAESDIRVKDDLGVHSNGLGGRFRLEERQVLPIVLDPDL